jgi:hypothetical protein
MYRQQVSPVRLVIAAYFLGEPYPVRCPAIVFLFFLVVAFILDFRDAHHEKDLTKRARQNK